MASGTKQRIVEAGAQLLRRQGYTGTGLTQIVGTSGAALGSIYHFFPGGKDELADEVIRTAGGFYGRLVGAILDQAPDPVTGVHAVFDGAAQTLLDTDFADACPIATVALEVASTHDRLRRATADVFTDWIDEGTSRFRAWGADPGTARRLAITVLTNLEGAFVLARSLRSTEPLQAAGASTAAMVAMVCAHPAPSGEPGPPGPPAR